MINRRIFPLAGPVFEIVFLAGEPSQHRGRSTPSKLLSTSPRDTAPTIFVADVRGPVTVQTVGDPKDFSAELFAWTRPKLLFFFFFFFFFFFCFFFLFFFFAFIFLFFVFFFLFVIFHVLFFFLCFFFRLSP